MKPRSGDNKDLFQSLTDPIRIRAIRLLSVSHEEVCLCEFVDSLLEPQYKVSKHLKILRQSGLLTSQKEGRWIYHRLVVGAPLFKHLYAVVCVLPDSDGVFRDDLKRFKRRLKLRKSGRCIIGIQNEKLAQKGTS